ncbi:MAG: proline--tRNA ligase [Candidatus Aminicenantes bacterium]|nr:proline--tRNA ligase [Candidatus Aminicenantes bacterium]
MKENARLVKNITAKSDDFSKWYIEIIRKAALADYAPIKGMMVIRPYGYAIWEFIQAHLDRRIKSSGHENAYFPLFVPESLLQKETAHLEGFSPEVAWVTQGGADELEERLAVRPTSEAIIGHMYSKWIKSYRDLPVLINQWANIVRWEKVTRPFLRTTEFLWQEGHTAHETQKEALEETLKILALYKEFSETELAVPVLSGKKTEKEKFAGAQMTYCIEGLMSDGKALQMGTSHDLGQNFAQVFNIRFEDREQTLQFAWQTSWGVSTRVVGAVVMCHGDDSGLKLPPRVAPVQVVIVPISVGDWKETVLPVARQLEASLKQAGIRVKLDAREEFTPGWKFSDWEMRGVPLRLEVGPRDVKNKQALSVRRDNREKQPLNLECIADPVLMLLDDIQSNLLEAARQFQKDNTHVVENLAEFKTVLEEKRGFLKTFWCGRAECEDQIKAETMATIRVVLMEEDRDPGNGGCICCGKESQEQVYFARAY